MAIMAMATARKINYSRCSNVITLLFLFTFPSSTMAGEWKLTPTFGLEETYTDNVELTITEPTSSFVSQAILGLDMDYESRLANFSFTAENNNLFYSHDSDIDDSYLTLDTQGQLFLWTNGPALFATAKVDNSSRNSANNSLADLVSGDTVQSTNYSTGILYNVNNSNVSIASSLSYDTKKVEDNIGEYDEISAFLNAQSGNNARIAFWQLTSSYSRREQESLATTRSGKQYSIDAILGFLTPWKLSPLVRFYDEDISGSVGIQNQPTTSSWGPGLRWLISQNFQIDVSYNYVTDDTVGDDYVDFSIQWEPSARTSITAGYSQRFFGNSYNLDLKHQTKRLTNTITYDESLEAFDRSSLERIDLGQFWCPIDTTIASISECFSQPTDTSSDEYFPQNFFYFEPVENNEFSLNKSFSWTSTLQLARTSFTWNSSASRREDLESKIINDTLSASFTIDRKISGKSNLTIEGKYDYRIFDKDSSEDNGQEDYYRTVSATYTKDLASSLSANFTVQHVNRSSNIEQFTYNELRAIINVTKEF